MERRAPVPASASPFSTTMATTRGDIERDIALLLGEDPDSPGFGEPMWLRRAVVAAADYVARATDCYYSYFTLSINDAMIQPDPAIFCAPRELYKLDRAVVTLADDSKITLQRWNDFVTPAQATRLYPEWQTDPQTGTPTILILRGPDLTLYPIPDWEAETGLVLHGWAIPADWAGVGTELPTDPYPLPEYTRQAVVYYAAYLRCIQFPTKDNLARVQMLKPEADRQIGLTARDAAKAYTGSP